MKKFVCFFLLAIELVLNLIPCNAAYSPAEKAITVTYNGQSVEFNGAEPKIINGCTLVPMRAVFEAAGCKVNFSEETKTVTAEKEAYKIILKIDGETCQTVKNGKTKTIKLNAAPCIISGKTMVPVRLIAESLGCAVNWNPSFKEVVIIDFSALKKELSESFLGKLFSKEVQNKKLYGITAYVTLDKKTASSVLGDEILSGIDEEKSYKCQALIDSDFNVYIKCELTEKLVENFADEKTAKSVKDKYIKFSAANLFFESFGITFKKANTFSEAFMSSLSSDEYVYSSTVKDISSLVMLASAVKTAEKPKPTEVKNASKPQNGKIVELSEILGE